MSIKSLSSNEFFNFIIHDTFSSDTSSFFLENPQKPQDFTAASDTSTLMTQLGNSLGEETTERRQNTAAQGRRKRRRRPRVCKNKEEAETQRMTHIQVERNRRKQMNEHLAVLRSLMPQSYVQRGDQASIVGGAIEFVKELEHLLQSLEAQKFLILQQDGIGPNETPTTTINLLPNLLSQFFTYPQCPSSQITNNYTSKSNAAVADVEVTLIESHANIRILSQRRLRQLSKMVAGFQTLRLAILHLNITTLDPLVLYSISAKVEEGCQLDSADYIIGAVHHMLRIIEEEATLC